MPAAAKGAKSTNGAAGNAAAGAPAANAADQVFVPGIGYVEVDKRANSKVDPDATGAKERKKNRKIDPSALEKVLSKAPRSQ
jgi:hypothetical protein